MAFTSKKVGVQQPDMRSQNSEYIPKSLVASFSSLAVVRRRGERADDGWTKKEDFTIPECLYP